MEKFLLLIKNIIDTWLSPSSMDIAMEMSIAIVCGAGLLFLLIPFMKECPVSPPPESERDIPKDVKRWQRNTKKNIATGKGCRERRKNVEETKNSSQPTKICTKQLLQTSMPQPRWNPLQKINHLPLFQLLSYLKLLEHIIQKEISQFTWGTPTMFSESVVATAHVLRSPSRAERKTMRFGDTCLPSQALSKAQGPPQHSHEHTLPKVVEIPSLVGVTQAQEIEIHPNSKERKRTPCFQTTCPTTERGTQTSLTTENYPWDHGLYGKDTKCHDIKKHQGAFRKPTKNKTLDNKAIIPEHCRMVHTNEEPHIENKKTNMGQQETPVRCLQSWELNHLQGKFPAISEHYCKNRPQISQPAQPSIHFPRDHQWSKMMETMPMEVPLRKAIEKCDKHNTTMKGIGLGSKDLPNTSSSTTWKGQNPTLRTDKLFSMNPAEDHSFLDDKSERELESNMEELPVDGRRPYMQVLQASNLSPHGVPASNLPQVIYPSPHICDSKDAMILENLHHQDPGGTWIGSVSAHSLESAVSIHSIEEVQETQRALPPAASHWPSKAHPDPLQTCLSVQPPDFCLQAKPHKSRTMQGTDRGSLQPNTSPKMVKYLPWKRFQDVNLEHPCCQVIVLGHEERVPPSPAKENDNVEVKEEPPPAWRVSLGSREIPNDQVITVSPGDFGSLEANKIPGHLQPSKLLHSQDLGLKSHAYSNIKLISKDRPQPWPVRHDPDELSTVDFARVNLPSQKLLHSFQDTCQDPITSQGERLERARPSISRSTQLKDTAKNWTPGKAEAISKGSWNNNTNNELQYGNISPKYIGQGDSLQTDHSPSATMQMQEAVTRNNGIYNMAAEIQSLMNALVQILEKTDKYPSKVKGCKVESLTSQLGDSSLSPEGLYDTNHSRAASRMSCGHASPEMHNGTFPYTRLEDKVLSEIEAQRACDQCLNQWKTEMGFDHLPMPKGYGLPCEYRGIRDKHETHLGDLKAYEGGQKILKFGMGHCPYNSLESHNRETKDKPEPGIEYTAFDPHQITQKGSGCFLSPKENHPVKPRATDCSWPSLVDQQDSGTK